MMSQTLLHINPRHMTVIARHIVVVSLKTTPMHATAITVTVCRSSSGCFAILPEVEGTYIIVAPRERNAGVGIIIFRLNRGVVKSAQVSFPLTVGPSAGLDGLPVLGMEITLDALWIFDGFHKRLPHPRQAIEGRIIATMLRHGDVAEQSAQSGLVHDLGHGDAYQARLRGRRRCDILLLVQILVTAA